MPTLVPAAHDAPPGVSEHHFAGHDGTQLYYRAWLPDNTLVRGVILLHRGHEHSGRWDELIPALAGPGTAIFAWDARGHGRSPGERGDAETFSIYVRDLESFARHLSETHGLPLENFALVAHSVGAVVAAAWVHDFAPPIRALVLATPAFRVKLYVPLAIPGLRLLQKIKPRAKISSYVGGSLLTHDRVEARRYDNDLLISRQISVRVLLDLHDTATRLLDDAAAIRTPTLLLAAGSDAVVRCARRSANFLNACPRRSNNLKSSRVSLTRSSTNATGGKFSGASVISSTALSPTRPRVVPRCSRRIGMVPPGGNTMR